MTKKERQRRTKLRRQARARRARKLFREFVANKKREWDAMVDAANQRAAQSHGEMLRVKKMFNQIVEQIIGINPEFPYPGREYKPSPDYIRGSGFDMVRPQHKWPAIRKASGYEWSAISETAIQNWYTFLSVDMDNDRMRHAKAYRLMARNPRSDQSAACQMAVSEIALSSVVTMEIILEQLFLEASHGLVSHIRNSQ